MSLLFEEGSGLSNDAPALVKVAGDLGQARLTSSS
jgi:hypothetical protein